MDIDAIFKVEKEEGFLNIQIFRGETLLYYEYVEIDNEEHELSEDELKVLGQKAVCKFMTIVNAIPAELILKGCTSVVPWVKKKYMELGI